MNNQRNQRTVQKLRGILDYRVIEIPNYEDKLKVLVTESHEGTAIIKIGILHKISSTAYNLIYDNTKRLIINTDSNTPYIKLYEYVVRDVIYESVTPIVRSQWKNIVENHELYSTVQYHLNQYDYSKNDRAIRARLDIPDEDTGRPKPQYEISKSLLTKIIGALDREEDKELKKHIQDKYKIYGDKTARRKNYNIKNTSKQ